MSIQQTIMEEQLSFESKLAHIHNTNSILDQLERKMNSYFGDQGPSAHNPRASSSNIGGSQALHANPTTFPPHTQQPADESMEFRIYGRDEGDLPKDAGTRYNKTKAQESKERTERLSQTTLTYNENKRVSEGQAKKFSNQFRLIGKSLSRQQQPRLTDKNLQFQQRAQPNANVQRRQGNPASAKKYPQAKNQSYLFQKEQPPHPDRDQQNTSNLANLSGAAKTRSPLINQMQALEVLMREKIGVRERKLEQIQQEIITENQERVYLYKVNVRLNEEIRFLEEQHNLQGRERQKNAEANIRNLQEQVDKLRKELAKKKAERKQLRREEQTLKDGYQAVLNNKKHALRKDIEQYSNEHQKVQENTEMLKGLMKQLDKLKEVVESKIKSSGVSVHNTKKVIRSFKC